MKKYLILWISLVLIFGMVSCKGGQKSQEDLLKKIPDHSAAFFKWDGGSAAYAKLLDSKWASFVDSSSFSKKGDSRFKQIVEVFKKAGLDTSVKSFWTETLSDAVFFVLPDGSKGAVIRPKVKDINALYKTIRKSIVQKSLSTFPLNSKKLSEGLSFEIKNNSKIEKYFLTKKENLFILAQSEKTLLEIIDKQDAKFPAIIAKVEEKKLLEELPDEKDRYGFAVADSNRLDEARFNTGYVVASLSMKKQPVTEVRFENLHSLQPIATKDEAFQLLSRLRNKPLLYLDSDGVFFERFIAKLKGEPSFKKYQSLIEDLKTPSRIALAVNAQSSQSSFLPLPEFLLLIKSDNPKKISQKIKILSETMLARNQMTAALRWSDLALNEKISVKTLATPIGFNVYLGTVGDKVVLTSSEKIIRSEMFSEPGVDVKAIARTAAISSVRSKMSLGNIFVDFKELGIMLEKIGGTLRMFAPQQQVTQELLKKDNIEKLKSYGMLINEFKVRDNYLSLQSYPVL